MLIYNYQMHVYSISKCNKDYRLFMARICSARTLQVRSTFFKSFRSFSKSLVRRLVPLSFISYLSVKVAPIFDLQINQRVENKLAFSSTRYNRNYNKNTTTIISSEKSCCESWQVNWINRKPFHSILIHTDKLSQTRLFVGYKNILIKIAKNTNKWSKFEGHFKITSSKAIHWNKSYTIIMLSLARRDRELVNRMVV